MINVFYFCYQYFLRSQYWHVMICALFLYSHHELKKKVNDEFNVLIAFCKKQKSQSFRRRKTNVKNQKKKNSSSIFSSFNLSKTFFSICTIIQFIFCFNNKNLFVADRLKISANCDNFKKRFFLKAFPSSFERSIDRIFLMQCFFEQQNEIAKLFELDQFSIFVLSVLRSRTSFVIMIIYDSMITLCTKKWHTDSINRFLSLHSINNFSPFYAQIISFILRCELNKFRKKNRSCFFCLKINHYYRFIFIISQFQMNFEYFQYQFLKKRKKNILFAKWKSQYSFWKCIVLRDIWK